MKRLFEHYRKHQFAPDGKQFHRQLVVHGLISGSADVESDLQINSTQTYQLVGNMHAHLCSLGWMNQNAVLDELPGLDPTLLNDMGPEEANQLLVHLGCFKKLTSAKVDANLRPDSNHPLPDNTPGDVWSCVRNAEPTQSLPDFLGRARYLVAAMMASRGV